MGKSDISAKSKSNSKKRVSKTEYLYLNKIDALFTKIYPFQVHMHDDATLSMNGENSDSGLRKFSPGKVFFSTKF